ncbi:hypothetical protein K0M31_011159 [Melipona bicolor]|uniref:G-protein coupled receptors family 2 profile 1 domain-containing protein n=1 Tax=Melipona bicolor TaxID=60889 RepID=A0AA40G943_9HYME|nr:hypothetical protein K0M31_011159 [Melipona bicolor]
MITTEMEPEVKMNAMSNVERFFIEQKKKCNGLMTEYRNVTSQNATLRFRHCPPHFDGLLCWSYTEASTIAILPCPSETDLMYQLNSATNTLESNVRVSATATKVCLANGQWYTNPNDIPESNYSLCELSNEFTTRYFMGDGTSNSQDYGNFESLLAKTQKSKKQAAHAFVRFFHNESVYGTDQRLDLCRWYQTDDRCRLPRREERFHQATKRRHIKCSINSLRTQQ